VESALGAEAEVATSVSHHHQFATFYELEYSPMVRLATALIDSRERAEELVQDAFERTLLRWERLDRPGAYLRTVVVNGTRSELRRRSIIRRHPPAPLPPVEMRETDLALLAALRALTPRRRVAVVLRYFDDQPESAIAEIMRCRVGTAKSLIRRGLADLRRTVEP
jgi:RNA polymerase sigma factor (sigma-70 family)